MKHLYPHPFSGSNAVSLDVTVDFFPELEKLFTKAKLK